MSVSALRPTGSPLPERIAQARSPSVVLKRQSLRLRPDPARVVLRPFKPATEPRELSRTDGQRANHIVARVLALDPQTASQQLAEVLNGFQGRHRTLLASLEARVNAMDDVFTLHAPFSRTQRQLIGAYFLHEYSFEAAALFNPSIVVHPDQSNVAVGAVRFILSVRAVGEGHLSSLTFRTGLITADGSVTLDRTARESSIPRVLPHKPGSPADCIDVAFDNDLDISERVIFPITESQSNGIEDARFVEMEEGGARVFYATYTAYSGRAIRSELIQTTDFCSFRMMPLRGPAARNKGMALFPRKFDGRYAMIGRQDNESLYLIYSEDLYYWGEGTVLLKPEFPWEFVQIGNCGSPIELDEGWLLLTHGVGPIRKYSIGAALLDKADPSKVLGRCAEPLLGPEAAEREGYVPNVVYTCGGLRHGDRVILPYAISDTYCDFATIEIAALLKKMI
jgi:predicted GH43/DUF377 family glycosyl hydrolase